MVNLNAGVIDDGNVTDPVLTPRTFTDQTAYQDVKALPGETLADVAARVFGSNSQLNRDKISGNTPDFREGTMSVVTPTAS